MADKKTILEDALLDIKTIQEALNANTKEILRSVAKEEIDGVVKESLKEADYEEEDLNAPEATATAAPEMGATDMAPKAEETSADANDDITIPTDVAPEVGAELGKDAEALDGGEEVDMTGASDDDVIAIYKKLSGEDEVEIVGDEIHLTINEPGEYIVKAKEDGLGEVPATSEIPTDLEPVEAGAEEPAGEEGDVDYEIEMGDDAEAGEEPAKAEEPAGEEDNEAGEKEELDEKIGVGIGMSVGTHTNKTATGSLDAPENPKSIKESEFEAKYNAILTESKKLEAKNLEFKNALKEYRTKLVETVVFNSNLTYSTRLFMEHSTTKAEKEGILKRFDEVTNLIESKKLYKTIANELTSRKPITESVEKKTIQGATPSSSKLNESTAYVDPSTKRIKDLINRVENR